MGSLLLLGWTAAALAFELPWPQARPALSPCRVVMGGFGKKAEKPKPVAPKFKGKETMQAHMQAYSKLAPAASDEKRVDVYVRSSTANKFWFVGKSVAADGICSAAESVVLQKRLILEHAKLLQTELALARELQLWTGPPNTEIKVAERRQPLTSLEGVRVSKELISKALDGPLVGFEPEQYLNARDGFYDDGTPATGSEINPRYVAPDKLGEELSKEDASSTLIL